nr:hypothetical protein GZ9C4_5 [uncultured archaeon GZfos9C4]
MVLQFVIGMTIFCIFLHHIEQMPYCLFPTSHISHFLCNPHNLYDQYQINMK